MRTSLTIFAVNILLWTLQSQINHYTATWQLTASSIGLCITFAALRLPFREGMWALILTGLWIDASSGLPFGMHAFLFVFAQLVVFGIRGRVPREETLVGVIIAGLSNLLVLTVVTVMHLSRNPEPLSMALRVVADSLASFALISVVGPWFFALSEHALAICGIDLRREQRGVV